MTFIFRCDSAEFIGSGHIRRCLHIAKELKERGADSIFICNSFEGNINKEIKNNFEVLELPKKNFTGKTLISFIKIGLDVMKKRMP